AAPCRSPDARLHADTRAYTSPASSCSCPSRTSSPTGPRTRRSRLVSVRNPGSTSRPTPLDRPTTPRLDHPMNQTHRTHPHRPTTPPRHVHPHQPTTPTPTPKPTHVDHT